MFYSRKIRHKHLSTQMLGVQITQHPPDQIYFFGALAPVSSQMTRN